MLLRPCGAAGLPGLPAVVQGAFPLKLQRFVRAGEEEQGAAAPSAAQLPSKPGRQAGLVAGDVLPLQGCFRPLSKHLGKSFCSRKDLELFLCHELFTFS